MPTTTSNMSLKIPLAGESNYPTSVSDTFTLVDTHDHSPGNGVPVAAGGLGTSSVLTASIAPLAVTKAKLAALGQQISSASGNFSTSSLTLVDVTNLTVTITTTGRPVYVGLIPDTALLGSSIGLLDNTSPTVMLGAVAILEGATVIAQAAFTTEHLGSTLKSINFPGGLSTVRVAAAGTYTYKAQACTDLNAPVTNSTFVVNYKLIAFEL